VSEISIMDRVLRFLRAVAVWLVVTAWLLFVAVAVVAFSVSVGTAINATYFPYHPRTPVDRAIAQVWLYAVATSLLAAVASSIALALKRRPVASGLVVSIWSVFLIYAGWALSVVKPGPEYFERFLGTHAYLISWHYAPFGTRHGARTDGFDVNVCLNTLQGGYGGTCKENDQTQVMMSLREGGFTGLGKFDERYWRAHISEMERAEPRYGHDTYIYTPRSAAQVTTTRYHIRYDAEGRLVRLVACRFGRCKHHALVDDYALSYDANNDAFSQWETTDRKLAGLFNSWRSR
jgi:hypothetical protein